MNRRSDRLQDHGLSLPDEVRTQLKTLGIYVQPRVDKQYQPLSERRVVIGVESGGAIRNGTVDVGRYVAFCGNGGDPLVRVQSLDSLGGNGQHAQVAAPVLLRLELYRVKHLCQLLITHHEIVHSDKLELRSSVVFRGVNGVLDLEQWNKKGRAQRVILPKFLKRNLEAAMDIPDHLHAAVTAALKGASCLHCAHSHYTVDATSGTASRNVTPRGGPAAQEMASEPERLEKVAVGALEEGNS